MINNINGEYIVFSLTMGSNDPQTRPKQKYYHLKRLTTRFRLGSGTHALPVIPHHYPSFFLQNLNFDFFYTFCFRTIFFEVLILFSSFVVWDQTNSFSRFFKLMNCVGELQCLDDFCLNNKCSLSYERSQCSEVFRKRIQFKICQSP